MKKASIKLLEKTRNFLSNFNLLYFIKGGSWLLSADIIGKAAGLLLSIAFARLVSKQFYGQYKFILSVLGILSIVSLPGMNTAITQSIARGFGSSFTKGVKEKLKWSLVGSLVLIIISIYLKFARQSDLWIYFLLGSPFFPALHGLKAIGAYYVGKEWFHKNAIYQTIQRLFPTLAILGTLYYVRELFWVIFAYFVANAIVNLYFYKVISREKTSGQEDKGVINYGRHLSLMQGINTVAFRLDKLLIAYFLGFEEVAIYTIASIIPENSKTMMKMFRPLTLPKFSNIKRENIYDKIKSRIPILVGLGVLLVIGGVITMPYLINFLYTTKYSKSIFYAQILLISLIFGFLSNVFGSVLESQKMKRQLYTFNILYSSLQIVFLLVLTPLYGIMGVVMTQLIARFGGTAYRWYAVRNI